MAQQTTSQSRARPDIFYKYFPVESWLPKLLNGSSLLFSSRSSFNDPFDCRPAVKMDTNDRGRAFFKKHLKDMNLSPAKRLLFINSIMHRAKIDNNLSTTKTGELLDTVGVLCLATTWDNALMWSHYAKFHTGISVGFHSNKDIFRIAKPIEYTDELPIIVAPTSAGPELFDKTFQKKAKCWAYEDEWRVVKPPLNEESRKREFYDYVQHMSVEEARRFSDQRGAGIYDFCKSSIESVTLGMRISDQNATIVASAVKDAGLDIPIYKVLPPSTTYLLSRKLYL